MAVKYMYTVRCTIHTVPKVIDFPRYNMKCSGGNEILSHSVSRVPLHFMRYRGNLEFFLDSAYSKVAVLNLTLLEWKTELVRFRPNLKYIFFSFTSK